MSDQARIDSVTQEGSTLVERLTGIIVPDYRKPLLRAEFERIGGDRGVEGGLRRMVAGDQEARSHIASVMTIPETYLFRHSGHFELLREIAVELGRKGKGVRVLSAGCSTGEEVWSAAAVLSATGCPLGGYHQVVGWELCGERLRKARAGCYTGWSSRNGLGGYDELFDVSGDQVVAGSSLRSMVTFDQVNLIEQELPVSEPFDVVFFRNVAIYWRDENCKRVFAKLAALVSEDGELFVAPSDPVSLPRADWEHRISRGVRSYRRISPEQRARALSGVPSIREVASSQKTSSTHPTADPSPRPAVPPAAAVNLDTPPSTPVVDQTAENRIGTPNAGDWIDDVAREDPGQACIDRARTLADVGRYAEALEVIEEHETAGTVEGKLWRGILLLSLERDEEAVRLFRQCVFLRPNVAEYHRWLAVSLDAGGRESEARRARKNAVELGDQ